MNSADQFKTEITEGYAFKGDSILLGGAMLNGESIPGAQIKAPLKTFNRHGLIAGATGTGKTKTLQNLAERLSEKGVPVLLMDIKGDLSGLTQAGGGHPKIDERHSKIGSPWASQAYPCELLTISDQEGTRMRATISEFGPVLLSKILELNDLQSGIVSIIFKYCDDKGLPLLDIKDFRKVLQYISNDGKEEIEEHYGRVSPSSTGAIMRALITIEEQGADVFFGETSFDVDDLTRIDENGMGYINILRLDDIQSKPKLFSTFMLCLLAEIYSTFPEQGDSGRPELVIFIDEAHLIFEEASKALLSQIETIVKLIRSKGVGIFFVTQNPADVPEDVLSQLGMKVQHALRAFTAKDRKAIKLTAQNYPETDYSLDLKFKKGLIQNQLAAKEAYIARYYISVQKWVPAINRLKLILEKYDETVFVEEALFRLVEIHYYLGLEDEAKSYAKILGYNYNSSEWFAKSYKILNKDYNLKKDFYTKKTKIEKKSFLNKIIDKIN